MNNLKKYYEKNYEKYGFKHQREYPNEEFIKFLSRNFSKLDKIQKKKIKILETGCGSGANLRVLAEQGYNTFGIDLSIHAVKLAIKSFKQKKLVGDIIQGDMKSLPYKNDYFNAITDIFSSCHLNSKEGINFIESCYNKLKKNGIFFSYFPSKKSKTYLNKKNFFIDKNTLFNNMKIKKPIYKINNFPFRFLSKNEYCNILKKQNFHISYSEELTKTYFNGREDFTFNIIEAVKK